MCSIKKEPKYWEQCVAKAVKAAKYGNKELAYQWIYRAREAKKGAKDE